MDVMHRAELTIARALYRVPRFDAPFTPTASRTRLLAGREALSASKFRLHPLVSQSLLGSPQHYHGGPEMRVAPDGKIVLRKE